MQEPLFSKRLFFYQNRSKLVFLAAFKRGDS